MGKEKVVDRDIQRKRFIEDTTRDIVDRTKQREIFEIGDIRNVTEVRPEQIKLMKKRKLVV